MNLPDIPHMLTTVAIALLPVALAIICHEVAHGWVAWRLGDPTAKILGRLTLNPIKHIDPTGLAVFVLTAITAPFIIGWAKPVPVQAKYFKNPRYGMMLVAFAGPLTNFLLALLFALAFRVLLSFISPYESSLSTPMQIALTMASIGISVNCTLAVFNLMPVPPLDGSHIISGLLPETLARAYWGLARFGLLLVILLVASGAFGKILWPVVDKLVYLVCSIVGLNPQYIL